MSNGRAHPCVDCGVRIVCADPCDYKGHSHYVLGGTRCERCAKAFSERLHAERMAEHRERQARLAAHAAYYHAHGECPDDGEVCESCCEHEFDAGEGGYCINGCEMHRSEVA